MWLMSSVVAWAQVFGPAINGTVKDECDNLYPSGTFYVQLFKQNTITDTYETYGTSIVVGATGQFEILASTLPQGAYYYQIKVVVSDENSGDNHYFVNSSGGIQMVYEWELLNPAIQIESHSILPPVYPTEYLICDNGMFPSQITTNIAFPAWQSPVTVYRVTIQNSTGTNTFFDQTFTGVPPSTINFSAAPYNFNPTHGTYVAYISLQGNCGMLGLAPIARFSVKEADAPIFVKEQTCSFVDLHTKGNADYTGFQWYNDGELINGATSMEYTATQSGHYTVACTTALGCIVTSDVYTVALSPITATMTLSNTVACSSAPFAASATNVAGCTYAWTVTNANGTTSTYTGTNPSLSFAGVGNAQVKLVITNTQGCTKELTQTVNVLDCCGFNLSQLTVLGAAGTNTNYTALPSSPTNQYLVAGNITLNLSGTTTLTNTIFRVVGQATKTPIPQGGEQPPIGAEPVPYGPAETFNRAVTGSFITLGSGTLELRGVTFSAACNTMWGGIIVNGGLLRTRSSSGADNSTTGSNTVIRDSQEGLTINNSMIADICRTSFLNNLNSIQLRGASANGFRLYFGGVGSANNRTIKSNLFDSEPALMLFPYDNAGFYTRAHLSNDAGVAVYTASTAFSTNFFRNAIYGIRLTNHDPLIHNPNLVLGSNNFVYADCIFFNNKIAAIWHTNGAINGQIVQTNSFSYTDQFGSSSNYGNLGRITLPTTYEGTAQIRAERDLIGMQSMVLGDGSESELVNYGNVFGIYAANTTTNNYTDVLSSLVVLGSSATQTDLDFTLNEMGYFGINMGGIFTTVANPNPGTYRGGNELSNLRAGIRLEGTRGAYSINNGAFTDCLTGLHINRTDASSVDLAVRCNDFVSTTSLARTGIRLEGNMTINFDGSTSVLGGCDDPTQIGSTNTPNGNEVRNSKIFTSLALPTNFKFIHSSLTSDIEYKRYGNENVQGVSSISSVIGTSIAFVPCGNLNADNTTCRTATGIFRQAAPSSVQAFLGNNAPNPAANETNIHYTLPAEAIGKAQIVVYAPITGKAIFTQTLQEAEGNVSLNLNSWTTGIYPYVLLLDGKVIQSRKLAVVK